MALDLGNNPFARGYRETCSFPALLLLIRLKWLCDTYKREWITRTREEWQLDLAFTMQQYKDGLGILKKLKLVETKKSAKFKGSATSIRMTGRGIGLLDPKVSMESIGPVHMESKDSVHIKKEGNSKEFLNKKEVCVHSVHANASVGSENKDSGELGMGKTVKEIMSEPMKGKKILAPKPGESVNTSSLSIPDLWREVHAEVYPDVFQVPFTGKDQSQFKGIVKACPKGMARKTVETVLRHWPEFVEAVKLAKGDWYSVPPRPMLGFLISNIGEAVNFVMEPKGASSVHASLPSTQGPKKGLTVIKKSHKPEKHEIAGLDEILSKP